MMVTNPYFPSLDFLNGESINTTSSSFNKSLSPSPHIHFNGVLLLLEDTFFFTCHEGHLGRQKRSASGCDCGAHHVPPVEKRHPADTVITVCDSIISPVDARYRFFEPCLFTPLHPLSTTSRGLTHRPISSVLQTVFEGYVRHDRCQNGSRQGLNLRCQKFLVRDQTGLDRTVRVTLLASIRATVAPFDSRSDVACQ